MEIIIKNKIYITGASPRMIRLMKKTLTLDNPAFMAMMRRADFNPKFRRAFRGMKQHFKYYDYDPIINLFVCGRGVEQRLLAYIEKNNIEHTLRRDLVDIDLKKPLPDNCTLRPYQVGVPEESIGAGDNGIFRLDTAFGKTVIGLEVVRNLNKTCLIIVPRKLILDQFIETAKDIYGYDIGVIQGKINDVKEITVASIDTLRNYDINTIKDKFSIILIDEIQNFITDIRSKVIQSFNPKHLYGMTGTCEKEDGQTEAIFFLIGKILIDRKLPTKKPTVYKVKTNSRIVPNIDYAEMILELIEDKNRNILIKKIIEKEVSEKRKIICLTKRIAHNDIIKELLNKNIKCFSLDSTVKDKEKLFSDFRKGKEFDVIIGTFSLLSTGINLEILSSLIIAGDLRSKVLTTQSAGRPLRTMLNKPDVRIYDLVDNNNGILLNQWYSRSSVYKKMEWKIIDKVV